MLESYFPWRHTGVIMSLNLPALPSLIVPLACLSFRLPGRWILIQSCRTGLTVCDEKACLVSTLSNYTRRLWRWLVL